MLQAMIIGRNKESIDLIKAVCCYKNCKVIVIDNLLDFNFLDKEKIDIVFMEFDSLQSMATDLIFSLISAYAANRPVIIFSEKTDLSEDIELQKRKIFYRLAKPLNTEEIEHVIAAVIDTVSKTESHADKIYRTDAARDEERHRDYKPKAFGGAIKKVFKLLNKVDKKASSIAQGMSSKKLEKAVTLVYIPIDSVDDFMKKIVTNLHI
ncbi:MAG: hypothetical protein FVQ81_04995 [Candidatus Glassbacteria bacterium]|nr:hypothetical protein [Candidatus Glassbacteria bacterium]